MAILDNDFDAQQTATMYDTDRRVHQRLSIIAPASVCLGGGPWHDAALTRNLSAGGALIELPASLAEEYSAGDPIGFEVRIPAGEGVWPGQTTGTADAVVLRTFSCDATSDTEAPCHPDSKLVALRFCERMRFRFD
ncbi:MAG: PilZ domain-containing protein [Phycisphaerales bacterium]|nr:PilZ domain-containing protein [Phycisphaerales bacterium]MCB9862273.1 PilZ domain-containing protein [Phycisphaerales bacterium]